MFEKLIDFAIERRWLVLLAVLAMAALGVYNYQRLPIDAVPDITNVQVQINTAAAGYSPLETEQRITLPIETAMAGLPHLEQTRSLSRYGLSQVTVIFKDGTDLYFARQLIAERIAQARTLLPAGIAPALGPVSTGLGEIYYWTVEARDDARKPDGSPYTPADLREIQDWIIKPQLRNVPGVTEINSIGGHTKAYQIAPLPAQLAARGLAMADLLAAVEKNNGTVGAGFIEKRGEQFLVRAPGQIASLEELRQIVVGTPQGVPVRLGQVAEVSLGEELRTGAATENGREVVLGTVFMLIGENSRTVADAVNRRMLEINRTLPPGIYAPTVYNRTVLVDRAIATVRQNLLEGAVLVVAVLFLFLGNLRAALLTALVIPLAMLFTFSGMVGNHVSANLMSLGALDFGIIIDGAVVIVENCVRRLAHEQLRLGRPLSLPERLAEVRAAARESRRPLLFGQLIIMIVYLPIFALGGVEGRMFHPMAYTVVIALLGAMILSLTFIPAAVALFIGKRVAEHENALMRAARRWYAPVLDAMLANQPVVLTFAAATVLLSGLLVTRLGSEFVPSLNEGDLAVLTLRVPGTSLNQSVAMQSQLERQLVREFPEIERMFARIGTAEVATDPMPPNAADSYIMLKPERLWPKPRRSRDELIAAIQASANKLPGSSYEFSQPIQLRFNELISGVRSDLAIKLFGDDLDQLNSSAAAMAALLQQIPGASEVKVEQTEGLPMLTMKVDRERAARYGLSVAEVQDVLAIAVGGREAGVVFEGDRRFNIVVRLPEQLRNDVEAIRRLPVRLPAGPDGRAGARASTIPLAELASLEFGPEPNQVSRENGKRRVVISANVRGRDIGSFVAEAQQSLRQRAKLPPGYWTEWGGQFDNLQSAGKRLQLVVPGALLLVFGLLYLMFNNIKDGLLVFTGIPFALTGGLLALWLRDLPLSISAAVGFIALSGVAVLNGLVLIAFVRGLREQGQALEEAIRNGALTRLRPVLMTAMVASLGFVPMAIANGTGAEVQRPLATVVIGGILSSTFLTLLVLPVLYRMAHWRGEKAALVQDA
ncbi:CusA/CzcA family heavy metal efflux RND transporter [Oxalobacteraceae bacterium]|nr:CusA/CzcA family heavy metal efflux RND transporter [Oxalobacteraceae bacterium]